MHPSVYPSTSLENWKPRNGSPVCGSTPRSPCARACTSAVWQSRQGVEKLSSLGVLRKIQGSGTYVNKMEDSSLEGLMYYPPNYKTLRMVLEFRRMFDSCNVELFIEHARKVDISILSRTTLKWPEMPTTGNTSSLWTTTSMR